jgi:hypothetical protein
MSKIRALELAVQLHGTGNAETVLATAAAFAAFISEEQPQYVGKPRKAKVVEATQVSVAVEEVVTPVEVVTPPPAKVEVVTPPPAKVEEKPATVEILDSADDMRALIGKLAVNVAAGGAQKAREILNKYGASNFSSLKPANYAAARKDIETILATAEAA